MHRYPRHRRTSMWIGALFCFCSLFGASYATEVYTLVVLQGVLHGIGGSLLYAPCISYMSEWFVSRRGLANGIIFAGTAIGGLILPLLLPPLISKHGVAKTLHYLAVADIVLLVPVLPFVKPRLPESHVHGPAARSSGGYTWLKQRTFWFLLSANTLQGFAYFVPIVWLPTFATSLRLSSTDSSLALAFLNGASVVGRIAMGTLSDRFNPWLLAIFNLVCTSLATFILWGVLSSSFAGILAYGIAYGGVAGGWSSMYTGFVRPMAKDDPSVTTTIIGFLMLSRGIGNVLSTPISTALQHTSKMVSHIPEKTGFQVAGGQYERLIVYVGTCFAGAALVAVTGWGVDHRFSRR